MASSVKICPGVGGPSLGLEHAEFEYEALEAFGVACCNTLRFNRPSWLVAEGGACAFSDESFRRVDLLAGGVPCPSISRPGRPMGENDLFPATLRLASEARPHVVMLENAHGFLSTVFDGYREKHKPPLNESTGQMCRAGAGGTYSCGGNRNLRRYIGHITDQLQGEVDDEASLRGRLSSMRRRCTQPHRGTAFKSHTLGTGSPSHRKRPSGFSASPRSRSLFPGGADGEPPRTGRRRQTRRFESF